MMDASERELLAKGLEHATAQASGEAVDAALDELGWRDALALDPAVAVSTLFALQGGARATSSALDQVVVGALGAYVPLAAGLVLPALGATSPPGRVVDGGLVVRGLGLGGLSRSSQAVVGALVGDAGDDHVLVVVATSALTLRPVGGLDPSLGLVEVAGDGVPVAARSGLARAAWPAAVAAGQRALSHELVGASRAMLELAREHALERIQFGRPIGSFQAVRHRLADSLVAIEAADGAAAAAWEEGSPLAAAMAKALAGRGARTVARHCQQVLAGIGFTTEHPLQRYVRRVLVLDRLLGDARSLTTRLGRDLLDSRHLPKIVAL
jgi:alkylation response protein AidB-like acyl-CoA dehydrogenase